MAKIFRLMEPQDQGGNDPERYDPEALGPFGRCLRCFVPDSEERSYCLNCGHMRGFLGITESPNGEACFVHPDAVAVSYCTVCGRPICGNCKEREGVSFSTGLPTLQCKTCLNDMKKIGKEFFEQLASSKSCAKHRYKQATAECCVCELPLCNSCLYCRTEGILFRRIQGPYCLSCYRRSR